MNSEVQYIRESERCYFFIVLEPPQHGLGSKSTDHLIPYQESQRWWSTNAIQSNNKSPFLGSNVSIEWFSWLNGCQRHSLYLKRTIVCPLTHVVLIILYVISISVRYGLQNLSDLYKHVTFCSLTCKVFLFNIYGYLNVYPMQTTIKRGTWFSHKSWRVQTLLGIFGGGGKG